MTTTKKPTAPAATAPKPTTKFRVHYRTSQDNDKHHKDVDAHNIGHAHEQVRAGFDEGVRVFIDKTKVLKAAS